MYLYEYYKWNPGPNSFHNLTGEKKINAIYLLNKGSKQSVACYFMKEDQLISP